jgi:hypothetical protein
MAIRIFFRGEILGADEFQYNNFLTSRQSPPLFVIEKCFDICNGEGADRKKNSGS